jgi:trimethylamine:corrinoid methyltransferase-like protein
MMPKLCNRRSRPDWEKAGSKDIVSAAKERVEELLTKHECNELDPDVQRDLDKAMEKAKAELVQSN